MLPKFHRGCVLFLPTIFCLCSAQMFATERADDQALDAEEHGYLEALDSAMKAPGDQRQAVYVNYINLGSLNEDRHRFSEDEKYYGLACEKGKELFGARDREVAKTLN